MNDAQKKALLLDTAGIQVQELYETLTDPGSTEEFEEETATDFEKRTLNANFVTKLNEPYERHIFRSMAKQEKKQLVNSYLGLKSKHRTVIL